jgi:hypothetical protein
LERFVKTEGERDWTIIGVYSREIYTQ